jgi:hypothetical protein
MFCSPQSGLETVGNLNFVINVVKVRFDRISADIQLIGDLGIADPGSNQNEDFLLPGSQQAPAFQRKFIVAIGVKKAFHIKKAFHKVFAGVPQLTIQNSRHAFCEVWQGVTVVEDSPDAFFNQIVSKRLTGGHIKNSDIIQDRIVDHKPVRSFPRQSRRIRQVFFPDGPENDSAFKFLL